MPDVFNDKLVEKLLKINERITKNRRKNSSAEESQRLPEEIRKMIERKENLRRRLKRDREKIELNVLRKLIKYKLS